MMSIGLQTPGSVVSLGVRRLPHPVKIASPSLQGRRNVSSNLQPAEATLLAARQERVECFQKTAIVPLLYVE
jgi:hypothetical protein